MCPLSNVLKLIVNNLDISKAPLPKSPSSIEEPEDSVLSSDFSTSSSFPAKVTRSGSSLSADSIDEICNEEIKVRSVYKGYWLLVMFYWFCFHRCQPAPRRCLPEKNSSSHLRMRFCMRIGKPRNPRRRKLVQLTVRGSGPHLSPSRAETKS